MVEDRLGSQGKLFTVTVPAEDGKLLAWFHRHSEVLESKSLDDGRTRMTVRMTAEVAGQAKAKAGSALKAKRKPD